MNVLAIDFGSSNTVAVLSTPDRSPRVVSVDGWPLVPSAVFLENDGTLAVGREAERKARLEPARYEPNPKRRIDDGELLLGDQAVSVVSAIAAVFAHIREEVERQLGGREIDELRLTHPTKWGTHRTGVLVAAAAAAGLPDPILIAEPVAAAAHFSVLPGTHLRAGERLAVYDLGGGTFDCAIVGRRSDGTLEVLAEAGLSDVGGLDFDHLLLDQIGEGPRSIDPVRWEAIRRPSTPSDRRSRRALAEDVRSAKETLSRSSQTDLPLPDPFADAFVTRADFEDLIRAEILRTVELTAQTLAEVGLTPKELVGIYLVGGSSRIPLAANLLSERLGVVPTALDQPESTVAMGAIFLDVPTWSAEPIAAPVTAEPAPEPAGTSDPMPDTGSATVAVADIRPAPQVGDRPTRRFSRRTMLAAVAAVVVGAGVVGVIVANQDPDQQASGSPPGSTGAGSLAPTASTEFVTKGSPSDVCALLTASELGSQFPDASNVGNAQPRAAGCSWQIQDAASAATVVSVGISDVTMSAIPSGRDEGFIGGNPTYTFQREVAATRQVRCAVLVQLRRPGAVSGRMLTVEVTIPDSQSCRAELPLATAAFGRLPEA